MKTTIQPGFGLKFWTAVCLAAAVSLGGYAPLATAHSDGAIWGIGGLLAGSMLGRASANKREGESKHHTSSASTPAPAPAAAPAAPMTAEQKIQQLNALAAGGYITPQEYKTEKQAILNQLAE
jgi:hypothetical protein